MPVEAILQAPCGDPSTAQGTSLHYPRRQESGVHVKRKGGMEVKETKVWWVHGSFVSFISRQGLYFCSVKLLPIYEVFRNVILTPGCTVQSPGELLRPPNACAPAQTS